MSSTTGAPPRTPDTGSRVLLLLVNVLEDVFEVAVVGFQDGVLGAQVQRPLLPDGVLEAAVSESPDRLRNKKNQVTKTFSINKKNARSPLLPRPCCTSPSHNRLT